jgi:hypothetical protein
MVERDSGNSRRTFLKQGAAALGTAIAAGLAPMQALANRHSYANPGSLGYLDRNMYVHNGSVHAHFLAGEERGQKAQLMARGRRRFIFQGSDVIDVTEPLNPVMLNRDGYIGGTANLAYNRQLEKWLLIVRAATPITSASGDAPLGKYAYPHKISDSVNYRGLRGIRIYDATNPERINLLSEWSCDQGDPGRELQTGSGTHRNYYGGGRYAYLDTAPDNSFVHMESPYRYYTNCIQTLDVSDPEKPQFVSNWWVPGQRDVEQEEYRQWRFHGDRQSWTSTHGPMVVPVNVEDGGRYGYTCYGHFGLFIHDISDPANPRLVGKFDPKPLPGMIPFHTVDVQRLNRGFVIGSPEPLNLDCNPNEAYQSVWVVDVRDPAHPTALSRLPIPVPPREAPYDTFCSKRGRFGTHNPPFNHAPGRAHPNFTCYTYFNAGVQCFDLTRPEAPRGGTAYFIPPQGGSLSRDAFASFARDTDNVLVEWDRNLMWVLTNTGIYLYATPELGEPVLEPMPVSDWALPRLNAGHEILREL